MWISAHAVDASGNPDPITVPLEAHGARTFELTPPVGHGFTLYSGIGLTGKPYAADASYRLTRENPESPFAGGELIGYVALDTGSGNMIGHWS